MVPKSVCEKVTVSMGVTVQLGLGLRKIPVPSHRPGCANKGIRVSQQEQTRHTRKEKKGSNEEHADICSIGYTCTLHGIRMMLPGCALE